MAYACTYTCNYSREAVTMSEILEDWLRECQEYSDVITELAEYRVDFSIESRNAVLHVPPRNLNTVLKKLLPLCKNIKRTRVYLSIHYGYMDRYVIEIFRRPF
jgi:hypothetical protein